MNLMRKRYLLHIRKQVEGEYIDDYYKELQCLFKRCEFKDDSILRDHVVFGIKDCVIREQLLEHDNPSLESVIEICRNRENDLCANETDSLAEEGGCWPHSENQNAIPQKQIQDEDEEYMEDSNNDCDETNLETSGEEEVKIEVEHIDEVSLQDPLSGICDLNNTHAVETNVSSANSSHSELMDEEIFELRDHNYTKTPIKETSDEFKLNTEVISACDTSLSHKSLMHQHLPNSDSDLTPNNKHVSDTDDSSDIKDASGISDITNIDDTLDIKNNLITDQASDTNDTTEVELVKDIDYISFNDLGSGINETVDVYLNADIKIQDKSDTRDKDRDFYTNITTGTGTIIRYNKILFKCSVCDKILFSQDSLLYHERIHVENNIVHKKEYACKMCSRPFSSRSSLSKHLLIHIRQKLPIRPVSNRSQHKSLNSCPKNNDLPEKAESSQTSESAELQTESQIDVSSLKEKLKQFELNEDTSQQHKYVAFRNIGCKLGRIKFMCGECMKVFSSEERMRSHELTHINNHIGILPTDNQSDNKCDKCGKILSSQESLVTHMQTYKLTCPKCDQHFNRTCNLKEHMNSHIDDRPHVCPVCKKAYKLKKSLNHHLFHCNTNVTAINEDEIFSHYKVQSVPQDSTDSVERNDLIQSREKPLIANQSYKKIQGSLPQIDILQTYTCDLCSKTFKSKLQLVMHVKYHDMFPYNYCNPRFETKEDLMRRSRRVYATKQDLILHMLGDDGISNYKCDVCHKRFSTKFELKSHKVEHIKKEYQCHVCGKILTKHAGLIYHLRIHSNEKPFKCNICNKGFITKDYLKKHARVHTGEMPYCCEQCGLKFRMIQNLLMHLKVTHKEKQDHKCSVCQKIYNSKYKFNRHMLLHTRPHKCSVCILAFGKKSKLKKHMLTHRK